MTDSEDWQPLPTVAANAARAVLTAVPSANSEALLEELDGALASPSSTWILDIRPSRLSAGTDLPDGPFPVRAYVPSARNYRGEVIIWVTGGHLSGLEYAWITDHPPRRWPLPTELEIVPDS